MAGTIFEILCSVIILVGFGGVIFALIDNKWEVQDLESIRIQANAEYRGLWITCKPDISGSTTCWPYKSFFIGLPTKLQAARGFLITALTLSMFSFVLCVSSISTISCASDSPSARNRIRKFSAAFAFAAGFSILAGTSWYANNILGKYYEDAFGSQENRMVLGEAIFIGWGSSFVLLLGGCFAVCISCDSDEEEIDYRTSRNDAYVPPKISKEYV